ncbi:hypothetical protein AB6T38_07035 [Aliiglaciecola sp. SL4]|uniref:hypothetical protein n=1 Tax=Aliiglaciecola sp. SL4 TaxID=3239806 RepID=UPI00355B8EBC
MSINLNYKQSDRECKNCEHKLHEVRRGAPMLPWAFLIVIATGLSILLMVSGMTWALFLGVAAWLAPSVLGKGIFIGWSCESCQTEIIKKV